MMKKYIGMFILVLWSTSGLMAQDDHYYYKGNQVPLELNTESAYLLLDGLTTPAALKSLIGDAEVTRFQPYQAGQTLTKVPGTRTLAKGQYWAEITFPGKLTESAYLQRLKTIARATEVKLASPYFSTHELGKIGLSDLFRVKLGALGDPQVLLDMAVLHGVEVVGRNRFMPEWYTLAVTSKTGGNALEMANLFYASNHFAAAEPDLMSIASHCVNDPLFTDQWGHNNTGQQGVGPDINACAGWANWGRGDEFTIIAVLDHGIQLDHPDLQANIVTASFDTESGSSPSVVHNNHGTPCAGIVAARDNNNLGISGVAPDCSLMSISNTLQFSFNLAQNLADGINWAVLNDADVISNSWGGLAQAQILDDAINNALANGRGGLGTVMVFSSGNDNGAVAYPANSNNAIIAVGAMSPCGERKNPNSCDGENWGSNFGSELDVVAPGVLVPTTDRTGADGNDPGNFMSDFNGTSAACPHVAGLAGLLISLNPCLSQRQVANIIEKTAQKVGGFNYTTTSGRPNGTWDDEMGYGLIDIDAAMQMVAEMYIQNVTFSGTTTQQIGGNLFVGSSVDAGQTQGPVQVNASANLSLRAGDHIFLENGFSTVAGAEFSALPIGNNCNLWNENAKQAAGAEVEAISETLEPAVVEPGLEMSIAPNPFREKLTLRYSLATESPVRCVLFNAQGQEIMRIIDAHDQAAGSYEKLVHLPACLPAGIYFVRLEMEGKGKTKKLLKQ